MRIEPRFTTKQDAIALDEYASIMEELNNTEEEESYLREAYQDIWDREAE